MLIMIPIALELQVTMSIWFKDLFYELGQSTVQKRSEGMNCWEYKKCGREGGGTKSTELVTCPAYPEFGQQCARVAGTLCGGEVQGTFVIKLGNCQKCEFYTSKYYDKSYS